MTDDLVKWLRYCAPERRYCGRNELAMLNAADRIEKLASALRRIKDLHNQLGPEDEQVVMIRDDMTYFIVCEALGETP